MITADFNPTEFAVQRDPYPRYRRLRDETPVGYIESLAAYGLFRYDDCKNTFLHPEDYSARDFIRQAFGDLDPVPETPSLIAMDPPEHTPLRKLAGQAFTPSVTRRMEPKIESIVHGLLDEIEARGREFDFVNDFAAYVPVSVTAELMGVDRAQRANFKIWTADLLNAANRASLSADDVARIRASVAELRAYLETVIAERRDNPADDFISLLVRAEEDGDVLSAIQVLSIAILTHFGGSETPSHLISSSLIAMFDHPEVHTSVLDDHQRAGRLVDETLRYWSPVNLVFQTAAHDLEVRGVEIPGGSFVLSYIGSANRDERRFDDPDRFDLERDPQGHLSFAHGPHYCPGAALGKRMGTIALEAVLDRMPDIRRLDETTEWLPSLWVRGAKSLAVAY
ncbi:MAG: cytochrome P450 [Gammaproteobacteria bacterium]|jgi:cytochrome P450